VAGSTPGPIRGLLHTVQLGAEVGTLMRRLLSRWSMLAWGSGGAVRGAGCGVSSGSSGACAVRIGAARVEEGGGAS
jgi:hypothetical protein